jgi:hypothetical protein
MTIIRTIADLTRHDVRRIKRGRYEILAIETRHLEQGEVTEIIWGRNDKPDAIHEHEFAVLIRHGAGSARIRFRCIRPSASTGGKRDRKLQGRRPCDPARDRQSLDPLLGAAVPPLDVVAISAGI